MLYIFLLSVCTAFMVVFMGRRMWLRSKFRRRQQLFAKPLDDAQLSILQQEFHLYLRLPDKLKTELAGHIQIFLDEKKFFGCDGFEITERVRVLIAAQACLLIANKKTDYYPGFESILVYPESYAVPVTLEQDGVTSYDLQIRDGESWQRGPVVLAWNHVVQGGADGREGHNVVMHEFAHKLDEQNWEMDGLPILSSRNQYQEWARVLSAEYERLREVIAAGEDEVIDGYGATSPAEFFAVVTETFFEKPSQLAREHPDLYQQFKRYYQLDPAAWPAP